MAPRPNPKVAKAYLAMKELGISEATVKPVLKSLLKLYERNWEYIEAENYRALVDAIFESEDEMKRKPSDDYVLFEPEQPLKKIRTRHQDENAIDGGTSLQGAVVSSDAIDNNPQQLQGTFEPSELVVYNSNVGDESEPDSPSTCLKHRGRRVTSSKALAIAEASEAHQPCNSNEGLHLCRTSLHDQHKELVSPIYPSGEDKTFSESSPQAIITDPDTEVGIIHKIATDSASEVCFTNPTIFIDADGIAYVSLTDTGISIEGEHTGSQGISNGKVAEEGCSIIWNSENNAVYDSTRPQNETSTFSSANGVTDAALLPPEDVPLSAQTNGLQSSIHQDIGGAVDNFVGTENISSNTDKQNSTGTEETTYVLDVADITKGEERVKISIVNHYNDIPLPSFCYIQQNLIGENALVNISLARISKEDCCSVCVGDCLSSKEPCICAHASQGRNVYASDGILNGEFLEECISMTRNPQGHKKFFCEYCPLNIGKDKDSQEPCKGHIVRRFVKECWRKCHCSTRCSNRVLQRGITRKLQVFMTSGGKGWGLRTLEDLPKGAFVCEYVGEILTIPELYLRNQSCISDCADTLILDAGWALSKEIKAEKALCLDASVYGNVARFINHRCKDANLIAVPVKVETPDDLYHHVAFFTSKKVAALEELTRDYGIDFDDIDCCTKPFRCRCGSSFCRNVKRYNRKKVRENASKPLLLRD